MMQRQSKIILARPGPAKQPPRLKPFVAIELPNNPWTLCQPEYHDAILITCGHIGEIARILTANLPVAQQIRVLERRRPINLSGGRELQIRIKKMRNQVVGGWIWMKGPRGITVQIHDVKGFFQANFRRLSRKYQTTDLAEIMTRTRASLLEVGISSYQQDWYRCSSLTDYVWHKLDINLSNVPAVTAVKGPGNLQGYNAFGHTDEPVYSYDINSAYLSVMAEFNALRPFADYMWSARNELRQANDPAADVLKIASTIMPGKFISEYSPEKYYRPVLAKYIWQVINGRLTKAMEAAERVEPSRNHFNVYRYCVDGFIARTNIERYMDVGEDLGQWKPVKRHEYLTIASTNVWWTDREFKDGGFGLTEADLLAGLQDDPYEIPTTRTYFDWSSLEERTDHITLHQHHTGMLCRKCWEEDGQELHDCC
jgi:hypothetical protein